MDKNLLGGSTLAVLALAQRLGDYQNKPLAVGLVLGVVGLWGRAGWLWFKERRGSSTGPEVEDFAVHDALNLKITNISPVPALTRSVLYLTRVTKWDEEWKGYRTVAAFQDLPHMVILADQTGLPRKTPRIYQLLEFTNPSSPFIRTKTLPQGEFKDWQIPERGTWRLELQLRWDGGTKDIVRCFIWSATSLPAFIPCPAGRDLPEQFQPVSRQSAILFDAPQLVPEKWSPAEPGHFNSSIVFVNDGNSIAYDIRIDELTFDGWVITFSEIHRLEPMARAHCNLRIGGTNTTTDLDWALAKWQQANMRKSPLGLTVEHLKPLIFNVTYRDGNQPSNWYLSRCEMWRSANDSPSDSVHVRVVEQKPIAARQP